MKEKLLAVCCLLSILTFNQLFLHQNSLISSIKFLEGFFNPKKISVKTVSTIRNQQSATLRFAAQSINTKSAVQKFTISGRNLNGDVIISTNSPFTISKDSVVFRTSISYNVEEMASTKVVYVRFNPTMPGNYIESVTNTSEGADNKFLTLMGTAIDPNNPDINAPLVASNIITPNNDGKNDYWLVQHIDRYPDNLVKVFDQSGRIVYSKKGYANDWNGTYNNAPLSQGTYYYIIEPGAGLGVVKGFITVIRD